MSGRNYLLWYLISIQAYSTIQGGSIMKTPSRLAAILFFCALAAGESLRAETPDSVGFDRIWELVRVNSHAINAASSDTSAAAAASRRLSRHWFPRIYADARGYASNDPGLSFMSNLGQRSITASDFAPHTLNSPGTEFFQRGALGAELSVYEGGAPSANAKAAEKYAEEKREIQKSVYLAEFTDAASAYGRLIVLKKTAVELENLRIHISAILDNYQGGLNANPVEYSGRLGLKALRNRITALITGNSASITSYTDALNSTAGNALSREWIPADTDALRFADSRFASHSAGRESHGVKALDLEAESSKSRADGASAVFLPTIALFSEAGVYSGKRDTADSWSAGFSVRMNLVSPMDYGAADQARQESTAAVLRSKDARRREQIELRRLIRTAETLASTIATLRESGDIMDEQLKTTRRLFSTGVVKSFQLADVFSRKTDLVMNLAQSEEQYVMTKSGIYVITGDAEVISHE
jgi:outer membrane protein TolC